ncbi:MAG: phospholipase D-like domain-containing protein [Patescibacteria group bacterium]
MRKFNLFNPRSFDSKLFDEIGFYPAFTSDLKQASRNIVIESPFICYRRSASLIPEFVRALDRGVSITLNTRFTNEHDGTMKTQAEAVVQSFEKMGVKVHFVRKLHRKLAIIDKSVVWQGSLNILSHANTKEVMSRIESRTHSRAIKKFISVK